LSPIVREGHHFKLSNDEWLFLYLENLMVRAIGIDPGLAMTGYGVVETLSRGGKACDWGAIRTEAKLPIPIRLKSIYDEIKELLRILLRRRKVSM